MVSRMHFWGLFYNWKEHFFLEALAEEYIQLINTQIEDPGLIEDNTSVEVLSEPQTEPKHITFFTCEFCAKQLKNKRNYLQHVKRHNNKMEEHQEKLASNLNKKPKKFTCEVCAKGFSERAKLNVHKKIHSGIKEHICQICDKRFTLPWQLKVHIKTHLNQKDYVCNFCNRSFGQNVNLRNHIKSFHTLDRPFKCTFPDCEKAYVNSNELTVSYRYSSQCNQSL